MMGVSAHGKSAPKELRIMAVADPGIVRFPQWPDRQTTVSLADLAAALGGRLIFSEHAGLVDRIVFF
jgi:hypothetical protein